MGRASLHSGLAAAALALAGCATHNYLSPAGPRFAGLGTPTAAVAGDTLRVVSFNVAFARRVDLALDMLRREEKLRNPDILLLQEMDARGTARIATALGLHWVYYPALRHPSTGRDFGNAILSRFPIESDRKVLLPHHSRLGRTRRIAVGATLRIGERPVRVYSLHLATWAGNGPKARRRQLEEILADADSFPAVIIGGDFNSETVPEIALKRGYAWPTRGLPETAAFWTLDHVLVRGFGPAGRESVGVVPEVGDASDHKPIWTYLTTATPSAPTPAAASRRTGAR